MKCSFTIKHKNNFYHFDNELQLNDFISNKYSLYNKLGDIVFSKNIKQQTLHTLRKVMDISKTAEETKKLKFTEVLSDDSDNKIYENPYVGVNQFISEYTFIENGEEHNLMPIFKEEEYWKRRFDKWKQSGDETRFTEEEIDSFFEGQTFEEKKQNAANCIVTEDETRQQFRKKMELRWANQCVFGDAFHATMQYLFKSIKYDKSKPEDGNIRNIDLVNQKGRDAIIDEVLKKIGNKKFKKELSKDNNKKEVFEKSFSDILTKKQIGEIVDYAQQLISAIRTKYGKNCLLMPEITVSANLANIKEGDPNKILGTIDLLVIDEEGEVHIMDYKVSAKEYNDTSSAKKRTYMFQMQMYKNILAANGVKTTKATCEVLPTFMKGFAKSSNDDDYKYDTLVYNQSNLIHNLDGDIIKYKVDYRVKDTLNIPKIDVADVNDFQQNVSDYMKTYFAGYNRTIAFTKEEVVNLIKEANGFTPTESNMLVYAPEGQTKLFERISPVDISKFSTRAEAENQLVENVMDFYNKSANNRLSQTDYIYKCIASCLRTNNINNAQWETLQATDNMISCDWLKLQLSQYIYPSWELIEDSRSEEIFRNFGCILLKNIETNQIDIVRISTKPIRNQYNFLKHGVKNETGSKRTLITGALKTDLFYETQSQNNLLSCEYGNIELIETMLMLNNTPGLFENNILGRIQVINPYLGAKVQASNKQLLDSLNALDEASDKKLQENHFKNGQIKMANEAMLVKQTFCDIMASAEANENARLDDQNVFSAISSCKDLMVGMTLDMSAQERFKRLDELRRKIEEDPNFKRDVKNMASHDLTKVKSSLYLLYYQVLIAIAESRGITFKQQLRAHQKFLESTLIWKNGISGLMIDNPGQLQSESLNLLTKLCTEAYQNTRDEMVEPIAKITELVKKLKKAKSYSYIGSRIIGNQSSLYENMYVRDQKIAQGDYLFKHVDDVTLLPEEREFLKEALRIINRDRFKLEYKTDKDLEAALDKMEKENDVRYYRVPLAVASNQSAIITRNGLFSALKDYFKSWSPKEIVKRYKDKVVGLFTNASEYERENNVASLFELDNQFDIGSTNVQRRLENIASHRKVGKNGEIIQDGTQYYENNLETLLLKHTFTYAKTRHLNTVMPTIKAILAHLTIQGTNQNTKFSDDIEYLENYVKNKIKSEPILPKKYEKIGLYANKVKSAASFMALAFNPVIGIYQFIQGMWNDISLIIRKPDGTNAFTFNNFCKAFKIVFADMITTSNDRPSIVSRLNELYGINDMDMNTYIDRIKSDKHGFFNFGTIAYKFAQRPDYYNRMSIFICKCLEDGVFEAHSLKDGKLVYDFKKDKRFTAFVNNDKSNLQLYNQQKALYFAMAKQFVKEHTKNPDGYDFVFDPSGQTPLPRAYTNQEAESAKALSDEIYGYYSHEKKSMIQSTLWGCMWMQFRTFWSGKKNQYLQSGGSKLEGRWEQAVFSDGKKAYYKLDKNGQPIFDGDFTTEDTGFPVVQWKGDWKEGIGLTLAQLAMSHGKFKDMWYHDDPTLRRCYRSNLTKLAYDIIIFGLVGNLVAMGMLQWFGALKDDSDKDDIKDALKLTAANITMKSINNSFMDFNFVQSIGEPLFDWQPFSFSWMSRIAGNLYGGILGDKDFTKTVLKMSGVGNQCKYLWDAVLPDEE